MMKRMFRLVLCQKYGECGESDRALATLIWSPNLSCTASQMGRDDRFSPKFPGYRAN